MNKILFIDHDREITGSSVSLRYLIDKFSKNWDVHLFTMKELEKQKYFNNVNIQFTPYRKLSYFVMQTHIADNDNLFSIQGIIIALKNIVRFITGIIVGFKVMNNTKPDLIYINEHVICQFAIPAFVLNIPSILHVRSQIITGRLGLRNRLLNLIICFLNAKIFAITEEDKKQLRYKTESIIIVPEILNEKDYFNYQKDEMSSTRIKLGLPLDKKIIIMLGGINKIKGTHQFIGAIKSVVAQKKDVLFLLLGDSRVDYNNVQSKRYYDFITSIIERDKIQSYLKMVGMKNDVREYILASEILVSCNIVSHFSRPAIEAWALKKAVISTNTQHSLEHMRDGYNALIVKIGSDEDLANAILTLLKDDNLIKIIGENGYLYAKEKFSAEKNVGLILNECNKVLHSNKL